MQDASKIIELLEEDGYAGDEDFFTKELASNSKDDYILNAFAYPYSKSLNASKKFSVFLSFTNNISNHFKLQGFVYIYIPPLAFMRLTANLIRSVNDYSKMINSFMSEPRLRLHFYDGADSLFLRCSECERHFLSIIGLYSILDYREVYPTESGIEDFDYIDFMNNFKCNSRYCKDKR